MSKKKVIVIGSGPGGCTAAMILAHRGYEVHLYEKQGYVGGRTSAIKQGDFTFDLGPTFLMMVDILQDAFRDAGRKAEDYLDIRRVDPFYRLVYGDSGREFFPTADRASMKEQIDRLYPGDWQGYEKYMDYEREKYARVVPCLRVPYGRLRDYASRRFLKAMPYLDAHKSLFAHLGSYFSHDELKLAFTFQAKYLGMSPWSCPATFSIISYIEHSGGVHHVIGGLNQITQAMIKVMEEQGGTLHLGQGVERLLLDGRKARGVQLESGERVYADHVVVNADFGHFMTKMLPQGAAKKYTPSKLERMGISCSGFLLYLGVDKQYDIPHHNILFSNDYRRNVDEIAETLELSADPSVYVQNACKTDSTLAPEGQSTLYVLVPCPNRRSGIDWSQHKAAYRERVLDILEKRGGLTDLREHIVEETMLTPDDFEEQKLVYRGAVFNLAHTIEQMLWLRPHNDFEEFDRCYLTGGGTHPGSGLPTIIESGAISANLISKKDGRI